MHTDNKTKLTWVGVLRLVVGGIFRLISIVALLAVLGISYLLFQNAKQTKETQDLNVQLVEMRQEVETEEDNTDWSKGMLDINSDYKGWLTIYGTQISEPVVQGETNETYLRTNINKEHAEAGTLFLDETTDLTQDGNLIIYGHKMNDGTMFGTLDKYQDQTLFEQHPEFYIYLPGKILKYRIFSCYAGRTGSEGYRYHFPEAEDFQIFLDTVSSYGDYDTGTELSATDRIVTLSTCVNSRRNYRYLVHGKLSSEIITEE